ncbi:hypothetical protein VCAG7404_003580A, partial [Vibrio cholerae O1 str. AG-7404]
MLGGGG